MTANQEKTKKASKSLQKQIQKSYRAYEKLTVKLGDIQRRCKHPEPVGMLCDICSLKFDHDDGHPLYPDSSYQRHKAERKFFKELKIKYRNKSAH